MGDEAASLYFDVVGYLLWVPLLALAWIPLIIVGAIVHVLAVWVTGTIILVLEGVLVIRLGARLLQFRRAASRMMGVQVGWLEPPAEETRYVIWCGRKGIEPFRPQHDN